MGYLPLVGEEEKGTMLEKRREKSEGRAKYFPVSVQYSVTVDK